MRRLLLLFALLAAPLAAQNPTGPTSSAFGTVTAPAAGATIDSSGATLLSGIYRVTTICFFSVGIPVAADLANVQLQVGSSVVGKIMMPIVLNVGLSPTTFERVQASAQVIKLVAVGTGTVGVGYSCLLTWTPVS
jgi:hypothetical protein